MMGTKKMGLSPAGRRESKLLKLQLPRYLVKDKKFLFVLAANLSEFSSISTH
jgi:hypothetical protein